MKRKALVLVLLAVLICPAAWAKDPDNTPYAQLLAAHVKNGLVDYAGMAGEEPRLDLYLLSLERANPEAMTPNERFAYWINAYNAWTIKLVLQSWPNVSSIKDLGGWRGPWKKKFVKVFGGKTITLDDIENTILRPRFKDPRVHCAINCASMGCPLLRSEPFSGLALDQQLDDAARAFVNDPAKNRLEGQTLYVSKIFRWFGQDFRGDTVGFFLKYAQPDLKNRLLENKGRIKIRYLDYDWSLNRK